MTHVSFPHKKLLVNLYIIIKGNVAVSFRSTTTIRLSRSICNSFIHFALFPSFRCTALRSFSRMPGKTKLHFIQLHFVNKALIKPTFCVIECSYVAIAPQLPEGKPILNVTPIVVTIRKYFARHKFKLSLNASFFIKRASVYETQRLKRDKNLHHLF